MMRTWHGAALGAALVAAGACADFGGPRATDFETAALTAALSSVPVGYGDLSSSYVGLTAAGFDGGSMWVGGGRAAHFGGGELMGGGLGEPFIGGIAMDRGGHGGRGPFGGGLGCSGTFNATSGRVECTAESRNGLTITRSAQYLDAAGKVQQAFDTLTTNSVNVKSSVTGTITFDSASHGPGGGGPGPGGHHGPGGWGMGRGPGGLLLGDTARILTASTTISSSSDRTTSGLASTSTQRTTSGTSAGTESTTGTTTRGSFTATRTVGDTTTGLVIPKAAADMEHPYPTAGTVIRSIKASLTYANESPVSLTRREVVTYDGSATAKVTITENGTTKNCTKPLPRGPLSCS